MYYVCVLKSRTNQYLYVGQTNNLDSRIKLHNAGKVRSTKAYKPWELVQSEQFQTREEAVNQERFLKTGKQKEILKKKYIKAE